MLCIGQLEWTFLCVTFEIYSFRVKRLYRINRNVNLEAAARSQEEGGGRSQRVITAETVEN